MTGPTPAATARSREPGLAATLALYTLARLGLLAVIAGLLRAGRRAVPARPADRADRRAAAVDGAVPRAARPAGRRAGAAERPPPRGARRRCGPSCAGDDVPTPRQSDRPADARARRRWRPTRPAVAGRSRRSTADQRRPSAPPSTARTGGQPAGARAVRAASASCARPGQRREPNGSSDEHGVERAGVAVAEHHRQRALADDAVARDVAQVVGHQHRAGQHADADRADERARAERPGSASAPCRAPRPARRTRTRPPRRARRSRRAAGRRCRTRPPAMHTAPDGDQPPLPRQRHQRQPGQAGDREADERGVAHGRRRGRPRADQPQRPDPLVVGAADAVGVVVGEVDADHQRDRDDQREQRPPRRDRAARRSPPRCRPAPGRSRSAACAAARPRSIARRCGHDLESTAAGAR